MRYLHLAIMAAAAAALLSGPADAQSRRRAGRQAPAPAYADPGYGNRNSRDIYSTPGGYDGIIHWNTPHADGNLGSSSTGGGGGGA